MKALNAWAQAQSWFALSLYLSIAFAIFYGAMAGFFSLIQRRATRNPALQGRIIQDSNTKTVGVRYELFYSAINLCITGMIGATIIKLSRHGYTGIYYLEADRYRYGWWYLPVSFILAYLFQDFWFYWVHRLMHTSDFLMQKVHCIHHYSLRPRPITTISFHPLEGLLIYTGFLWIAILIPMYAPLFFFFTLFTLAHDVWVHCGYECFPKKWLQGGIVGRIFPSSTQHDLHHQPKGFRYNYSAYLFLWDRITGTLYPDYFGYLKKRYCESSTENDHNSNHRLESQASGRIGAP